METLPGQPIANYLDHRDNLNCLDRSEFDRDDRVNFEAIIWKRSKTTEMIETIKSYPRNHFYFSNRGEIVWPRDTTEAERKIQKCLYCAWTMSEKEIV